MHDLDQTRLEFNPAEIDDDEFEFEAEYETAGDMDEYESEFDDDEFEYEYEFDTDAGSDSPFSEAEEMELAAELMEIASDQELEYFLGKLIKRGVRRVRRTGKRVGRRIRKRLGGRLRKGLKSVAKKGLRFAGRAIGGAVGGPAGAAIGGAAGNAAGRAFGLELEGLSPEDQEFEAARRFVRLAGEATTAAVVTPESISDDETARRALRKSVGKLAPGLAAAASQGADGTASGRWVRQGSRIVLTGV